MIRRGEPTHLPLPLPTGPSSAAETPTLFSASGAGSSFCSTLGIREAPVFFWRGLALALRKVELVGGGVRDSFAGGAGVDHGTALPGRPLDGKLVGRLPVCTVDLLQTATRGRRWAPRLSGRAHCPPGKALCCPECPVRLLPGGQAGSSCSHFLTSCKTDWQMWGKQGPLFTSSGRCVIGVTTSDRRLVLVFLSWDTPELQR